MMFIGLILIIFIFYNYKNNNESLSSYKSPELRLKERFIAGELEEATYLRMLEIIRK